MAITSDNSGLAGRGNRVKVSYQGGAWIYGTPVEREEFRMVVDLDEGAGKDGHRRALRRAVFVRELNRRWWSEEGTDKDNIRIEAG